MSRLTTAQIADFSEKPYWVLDIDDCLYPIRNGLHNFIKGNIVRVFNRAAQNSPEKDILVGHCSKILESQGLHIENPRAIRPDELGIAFTPIVRALEQTYPGRIMSYLNEFYGDAYYRITPDKNLVQAFDVARGNGVGIFFYTNGPSSPDKAMDAHVQYVLKAHGCTTEFINYMRPRTYDLLLSVGDGCGKPTPDSMQNFLRFSDMDPAKAFMADDQVKNLKTAHDAGMKTLWTWTTPSAPPAKDIAMATDIGAVRVYNTGAALLRIAKMGY